MKQQFQKTTINFNVRNGKGKEYTSIYVVVYINGKQYRIGTGLKVKPEQWDKKAQRAKINFKANALDSFNNDIVNQKLSAIYLGFSKFSLYFCTEGFNNEIDLSTILNYIGMAKKQKQTTTTMNVFRQIDSILFERYKDRQGTFSQYSSQMKRLERYFNDNGIDSTPTNFNQQVINDYLTECKGQVKLNTFKAIRATIGVTAELARDKGIITDKIDVREVKAARDGREDRQDKKTPLTEDELMTLKTATLDGVKAEARDIFILQCYTGQRISDVLEVLKGNYNTDGQTITLKTIKTKGTATFRIYPEVRDIIERYRDGMCYLDINNTKSTTVRIDKALKSICKDLSVFNRDVTYTDIQADGQTIQVTKKRYDMITSHIARHTFVSLMSKMGMRTEDIRLATGHKSNDMIDKVYNHVYDDTRASRVIEATNNLKSNNVFVLNGKPRTELDELKQVLIMMGFAEWRVEQVDNIDKTYRMIVEEEVRLKQTYNIDYIEIKDLFNRQDLTLSQKADILHNLCLNH